MNTERDDPFNSMVVRSHDFEPAFKVWSRHRAWFWFVANPYGDGGTIGTAATEAEAIRASLDVLSAMEDKATRRSARG